jgi:hypothetical protein
MENDERALPSAIRCHEVRSTFRIPVFRSTSGLNTYTLESIIAEQHIIDLLKAVSLCDIFIVCNYFNTTANILHSTARSAAKIQNAK